MRRHILHRWLVKCALAGACFVGGASIILPLATAQPQLSEKAPAEDTNAAQSQIADSSGIDKSSSAGESSEPLQVQPPAGTESGPRATVGFQPAELPSQPSVPATNSVGETIITLPDGQDTQPPTTSKSVSSPAATVNSISYSSGSAPALPRWNSPTVAPHQSIPVMATLDPTIRFPRAQPAPERRSYIDLTAAPCFAHAPDYSWITGRVEYLNMTKTWRLRYTSVDEVDRHGGCVHLIDSRHVKYLKDGMYLHVRGHIVNPDNESSEPTFYRIESYEVVDNPNQVQTTARPR